MLQQSALQSQSLQLLDLRRNQFQTTGTQALDTALEVAEFLDSAWFDGFSLKYEPQTRVFATLLKKAACLQLICTMIYLGVHECAILGTMFVDTFDSDESYVDTLLALMIHSWLLAAFVGAWMLCYFLLQAWPNSRSLRLNALRGFNVAFSIYALSHSRDKSVQMLTLDVCLGALVLLEIFVVGVLRHRRQTLAQLKFQQMRLRPRRT